MSILGIGVDVVHITRFAALLSRRAPQKFANRILSTEELTRWQSLPLDDRVRFLAVRWAVKEAAYKALYPTVRPTWKDLSYHGLRDGHKPSLQYYPRALDDRLIVGRMHVSVSHDGEYVFTSVLVEAPSSSNV